MIDPPSRYWKFKSIDTNTFKMLALSQLWFADPETFNDPFDTNLDLLWILDAVKSNLINYNKTHDAIRKRIIANSRRRYTSRFLYCMSMNSLDFPPYKDVLMWSHYANEHKGICLGMSMSSVQRKLSVDAHVGYTDWSVYYGTEVLERFTQFVDNTASKGEFDTIVLDLLFDKLSMVKATNWSYENEHRFIYHNNDPSLVKGVLVDFDGSDLEHIVFGLKASNQDRSAIKQIVLSNGWDHVKFWDAKMGKEMFDIDIVDSTL